MVKYLIVGFIVIVCCTNKPIPPLPPSQPIPLQLYGEGNCSAACNNLQKYGCTEYIGSPSGTPCVEFCEDVKELLPVSCVETARSLSELRVCGVKCSHLTGD